MQIRIKCLSYQNENLFKRVSPLAEKINSKICELADVQEEKSLDFLYDKIKKEWGKLDFLVHALAYSDKEELTGRFINSSRENFLNSKCDHNSWVTEYELNCELLAKKLH